MNSEELKLQISSVQNERDRLTMLLSEYVGDDILVGGERAVKSRKESLWKLINDLKIAFNLTDPLSHELFKNTKEMNEEGYERLFTYYDKGINRLNAILKQDVYQLEPRIVKGHRARNIISHKSQNLQIIIKEKANKNNNDNDNIQIDSTAEESSAPIKRVYRKTTEIEKKILEISFSLESFSNINDDNFIIINNILQELQKVSTNWDLARVKKYWTNNKKK
ncbi:unnamed protein product [Rhizophagus irregularis]|nr:unnamed protein product [Rhizophagus irregularis]CAB5326390.1 unnamed protein product [Rhizophagus irregularis]